MKSIEKDDAVKACSRCGETKSVSEFGKCGRKKKDGTEPLHSWCKGCCSAAYKRHRAANPDKYRAKCRKWSAKQERFGKALVASAYAAKAGDYAPCSATRDEIVAAFTGRCEVCGVPEIEMNKKLCMDHDHSTGEFRGWLCGHCNRALGLLGDSEDLLVNALHYLMARTP